MLEVARPAEFIPVPVEYIEAGDFAKKLEVSISQPSSPTLTPENELNFEQPRAHGSVIPIDIRSMLEYNASHVRTSINFSNCPLLSKRISRGKLSVMEYLEARVCFDVAQDVVIYEDSETDPLSQFAEMLLQNLSTVKHNIAISILKGGFTAFKKQYPGHCTNGVPVIHRFIYKECQNDEMAFLNWKASKIEEHIYIGGLHDAKNDELLDEIGITHVLNCCKTESREENDKKYKYHRLMCDDSLQQRLDEKLDPAFKFIKSAADSNGKVLIHCYAGISRSAAITIAFLMFSTGMKYDDAYRYTKQKRAIIAPNLNFISQLVKFEEQLKEQKVSDADSEAVAKTETKAELHTGGNLLMKKRKFAALPLKLPAVRRVENSGIGGGGGLCAASAPIMNNINPFAAAFKKAASESAPCSPPRTLDSLCE